MDLTRITVNITELLTGKVKKYLPSALTILCQHIRKMMCFEMLPYMIAELRVAVAVGVILLVLFP